MVMHLARMEPLPAPGRLIENLTALLPAIKAGAGDADSNDRLLKPEIDALADAGLLIACLPVEAGGMGAGLGRSREMTRAACTVLRLIGRASLSVARLFEGHMNAVKLLDLYGSPILCRRLYAQVSKGALLGVWGADGRPPLTAELMGDGRLKLDGGKVFASGLGLVGHAVVTLKDAATGASRLAIVDVSAADRQDPGAWKAASMRATHSGAFDFTGLCIAGDQVLGEPGDYETEPHFEGGVWRYAAAHLGAAEGLVDEWQAWLTERDRAGDPLQITRFAQAVALCQGARAMIEQCCLSVEDARVGTPEQIDMAVARSLLTRQLVEDACVEVLALVEKSIGVQAHIRDTAIERMRRDLSLYIRQAAPDAKLIRAGKTLLRNWGREDAPW